MSVEFVGVLHGRTGPKITLLKDPLNYYDLGVNTFLIRGVPKVDSVPQDHCELISLMCDEPVEREDEILAEAG